MMEPATYSSRMYEKILEIFVRMQDPYTNTVVNDITKWTKPSEMENVKLQDINYDILFDLSSDIIRSIPDGLQTDPEVKAFMNYFTEITSSITTHTITNEVLWNVDLNSKFQWLALILSIKTSYKLIPFFAKLVKDEKYVLQYEDNSGNNCFTFACWNISSLIELIKIFGWSHLKIMTANHITPLDLLAYSGALLQLLQMNIVPLDEVLSYANPHYNMNVLHFCAMSSENTDLLTYLVASDKLTREHLYLMDKNRNFPLLLSCIFGSSKNVDAMLRLQSYGQDVFTINNLGSRNVLYYAGINNLLGCFINFVDETNFFDMRFYNMLMSEDMLKVFINSKLFTHNIMTKSYPRNGEAPETNTTNLIKSLLNHPTFDILISSKNERITGVMKQVFDTECYLLALSVSINIKVAIAIMKSDYMTSKLLKGTHNSLTVVEKLITSSNRYIADNKAHVKELTTLIIDCPFTDSEIIKSFFINFCGRNFCDLVHKLVERKLLKNIIEAIDIMMNDDNISSVVDLLTNTKIDFSQLEGQTELLSKLVVNNEKMLQVLLSNSLTRRDIVSILTTNHVIDCRNVKYDVSPNTWSIIVKSLHKDQLNSYNLVKLPGSIVDNIDTFEKLKILVDNRPDFDQSLFFKKIDGFLTSACLSNDTNIVKYLINHTLFTKPLYDSLIHQAGYEFLFCESTKNVLEQLIRHEYFNEDLINKKFQNGNNLLQHLMEIDTDRALIKYIVDHEAMTLKSFHHCNDDGDNCLMTALYSRSYVPIIINSKHFNPEMMRLKNNTGVSAEDIIYEYLDCDFLIMYFELFPKSDLIRRRFSGGNTIAHELVRETRIHVLVELLNTLGFDILTITNDIGTSVLHKITHSERFYNELNAILSGPILCLKESFYVQDKYHDMPLTNIIVNTNQSNIVVFETMISSGIFDYSDVRRQFVVAISGLDEALPAELIIDTRNITIAEFIVTKNLLVLDILDKFRFDVPSILSMKDDNNETLYFKLLRNNKHTRDKTYAIYIDKETLMMTNCHGNTFLYEVLVTDQLLATELLRIIDPTAIIALLSRLVLYPAAIKFLLTELPELFTKENLLNCIDKCADMSPETLEMLILSEYLTKDILMEIYNKHELLNVLLSSPVCLNHIFENNLLNKDILKLNNHQLMFRVDNPLYIRSICDIIMEQSNDLLNVKYNNKTIFHKCVAYPGLATHYIRKYLELQKDSPNTILLASDNYKKTVLDYLVENNYMSDIEYVINNLDNKTLYSLVKNQDYKNMNFVMKCCTNNYEKFIHNIKHHLDNDILLQEDNDGTSTLMYITRYTSDLLSEIISKVGNLSWIENSNNDDLFTVASRYNSKNLRILLREKQLVDQYEDFDRCFAIACRYEASSIGPLLNTKKIKLKKCNGLLQYDGHICFGNFLQIACRYNSESVKELLNRDVNLREYIDHCYVDVTLNIRFNALKLAMLYEPNAYSYLLESKYVTSNLIDDTDILCMDNSCIIEMINKQMASYVRWTKSKHFKQSMYKHPKYGDILHAFNDIIIVDSISDKLLTKYKDVPCDETNSDACSNCFSNQNRVIFSPCQHKYCLMCSTRMATCPQCRIDINDKLVYN
jgi:hypothetical protein